MPEGKPGDLNEEGQPVAAPPPVVTPPPPAEEPAAEEPTMHPCPECGEPVPEDAPKCPECDTELEWGYTIVFDAVPDVVVTPGTVVEDISVTFEYDGTWLGTYPSIVPPTRNPTRVEDTEE